MSTTIMPDTAVRDPYCRVADPGHLCLRRDGQPLNGSNGDCWTQARLDTVAWVRRPRPGLDRETMCEAEAFQALRGESYGLAIIEEGADDIRLEHIGEVREDIASQYPAARQCEVRRLACLFLRAVIAAKRRAAAQIRCSCPSPLGCHVHGPAPRERAVPCRWCRALTWNVSGCCTEHEVADDVDRLDGPAEATDDDTRPAAA